MTDETTTIDRSVRRTVFGEPHVDVRITVEWTDAEEALELADELSTAVHETLAEHGDDGDET